MSCEGDAAARACAGRVSCIHAILTGFGRPLQRARVKEARPLFVVSGRIMCRGESKSGQLWRAKAERLLGKEEVYFMPYL